MSLAGAGRPRIPVAAIVLALLALLLTAGMAVRSALAASQMVAQGRTAERAIRIAIDPASSVGDLADAERSARRALIRDPASAKPLVAMAYLEQRRGNLARAVDLMEQAVGRNPRDVAARMWLIQRYLRLSRFAGVVRHIDAVMRLRPGLRAQLVAVLVPLQSEPAAREAIGAALARRPVWSREFIFAARLDDRTAAPFYALVYDLGSTANFTLSDIELNYIVTSAVGRGDYREARTLYDRFVQRTDTDPANVITDGDFRGVPGPAPFNWTLNNTVAGFARIEPRGNRGRLVVRTFTAQPAILASQTILMPAGEHILSTTGTVDGAAGVEGLGWTLSCDRSGAQAARLDIAADAGRFDREVRFTTSEQCRAATVNLAYAPAGRASFAPMAFETVAIRRADGPAR